MNLYKLVEYDPELEGDETIVVEGADIPTLESHVRGLHGASETFYVVRVPSEGETTEHVCKDVNDLAIVIRGLASDNDGELFIYRGEKITLGEPSAVVSLSIGEEMLAQIDLGKPAMQRQDMPAAKGLPEPD